MRCDALLARPGLVLLGAQSYEKEGELMIWELTEAQEEVRRRARELAQAEVAPGAARRDEVGEFDRAVYDRVAQAGLSGLPFPTAYGGQGADLVSMALAIEEVSATCASLGLALTTNSLLAAMAIFQAGSEDQKRRYLVPLASGEKLGSFCLTEPGAGSDAASLHTTARHEGEGYILQGTKVFSTNAGESEVYAIFATTDPSHQSRGISAFIVEKDSPRLSFGSKLEKLGMRGSVQRSVILDEVAVSAANLLGREGEGMRVAMAALDLGRIGIAAQAVGIARAAYEEARRYATARIQFGRAISENQAIAFMLADMDTEIEAARLLTGKAAYLAGKGQRVTIEAAQAKAFATDTAMKVTTDAVQILGGLGATKGAAVERYFRDAKVTQIYEGTNQIMRVVISGSILRQREKE